MNLLDLAVKITCDDQASGEVGKIGDGIKTTLGTAAKVGGAALAAVGTATVVLGKKALDAYADYEQLVGGIETLFKGSADKVKAYADAAYKTAGTSANRYMEITTSFAASLINSLGGDTAKAADMANMAVMDMSDNANKMGTAIETVQEAYQSLARGNYEMLDSLKLGYGGTKSELQRLLDDAEKYAAAQGKVRDFSIDSYADIVEAIHIVQDEMGITGTTAEEASETISGSINAAKAAFDNWMAGLGDETADMQVLTDQLVDTIVVAAENIIPRVGEIFGRLGDTIASKAPDIAGKFGNALLAMLPQELSQAIKNAMQLWDMGGPFEEKIRSTFGYIQSVVAQQISDLFASIGLDELGSRVAGAFSSIGGAFTTAMASFSSTLSDLLGPALQDVQPILDYFFQTIEEASPWLSALGEVIGGVFATAVSAAVKIFWNLVIAIGNVIEFITYCYNGVTNFANGVYNFFTVTVPQAIQSLVTWFAQLPGNIAAFLSQAISTVAGWVGQMASNAVSAGSQFIGNVGRFISQLPGNIASFLGQVISRVGAWIGEMASGAVRAASQFGSNLVSGLASIPGKVASVGANIVQGMVDGVLGAAGRLIDAVSGAVGNAIDAAKNLLGIHSPSRVFREIGRYTMQGMALGIDDDAGFVTSSTDDVMRNMVSSAESVSVNPYSTANADSIVDAIYALHKNLGAIIAANTPAATPREFARMVKMV